MKIFKYILQHKLAALVITLLLFITTSVSFILPTFTSNIINVGIQQNGIEHQSPECLSVITYDKITLLTNNDQTICCSYNYDDNQNCYTINDYGIQNRKELDLAIEVPLGFIYKKENVDIQIFDSSYIDKMFTYKNQHDENLLKQKAIAAAKNELIDNGINVDNKEISYLINQGLLMILVTLFSVLVAFANSVLLSKVSMQIGTDKRAELFKSVINFSSAEIDKFSMSSLITRATNDIQNVQAMCTVILSTILYAPVCIIVGFCFAIVYAPQLSWILVVVAFGVIFGAFLYRQFMVKYFRKLQKILDKVNLMSWEIICGIPTSRAMNKIDFENKRFDKENTSLYKLQVFTGKVSSCLVPLITFASSVLSIIIYLLGSYYVNTGSLQVGNLTAFITYTALIIGAFTSFGRFLTTLPKADISVNRLEDAINCSVSIFNDIKTKENLKFDDKLLNNLKIKFDKVSFSYQNSGKQTLHDISFTVNKGDTIGIVGTVGSGKSTLLSLLLRLQDVTNGEILINGINIKDVYLESYRGLFALVPQQSSLFSGTIKDNVSFGIKNKDLINDKEYIKKYINISQSDDFVYGDSSNGLDTEITHDSTNISGGQRQRLAIARALASDRPILVFDDCFSALDYKTEKKLLDSINNHYSDKTKVIVSTRLSCVKNADTIVVLENGNMVGCGKHEKLIKHCGEYINICKAQLGSLEVKI